MCLYAFQHTNDNVFQTFVLQPFCPDINNYIVLLCVLRIDLDGQIDVQKGDNYSNFRAHFLICPPLCAFQNSFTIHKIILHHLVCLKPCSMYSLICGVGIPDLYLVKDDVTDNSLIRLNLAFAEYTVSRVFSTLKQWTTVKRPNTNILSDFKFCFCRRSLI